MKIASSKIPFCHVTWLAGWNLYGNFYMLQSHSWSWRWMLQQKHTSLRHFFWFCSAFEALKLWACATIGSPEDAWNALGTIFFIVLINCIWLPYMLFLCSINHFIGILLWTHFSNLLKAKAFSTIYVILIFNYKSCFQLIFFLSHFYYKWLGETMAHH